jgi:hypothetical protein
MMTKTVLCVVLYWVSYAVSANTVEVSPRQFANEKRLFFTADQRAAIDRALQLSESARVLAPLVVADVQMQALALPSKTTTVVKNRPLVAAIHGYLVVAGDVSAVWGNRDTRLDVANYTARTVSGRKSPEIVFYASGRKHTVELRALRKIANQLILEVRR